MLAFGPPPFAQIIAAAFVEGTLFVFFRLSESAALPQVVPKPQLPTAIARNQAREQGADLAGQPLGGALFGVAHLLPFLADAVSYAVSFASLLFVRPAFQEERERTPLRLRAEIVEGISWLYRHAFLRATILLVAGSNFAFSAIFLALIVRARNLGTSPAVIGVMLGFVGAGAIVGSFAAPPIQRLVHPKLVVIGSLGIWAVAGLILAVLRVREAGYRLINADCVLIGEQPRIAERRAEMESRLSEVAGGAVGVRATTTDELGFTGRNEGLAAQVVALLSR